jgi:hypothetical protein
MQIERLKIGRVRPERLACLACLLLVLPAGVDAQILAPREAAQIEFGPLSLYPSLRVVDAGVDENVFNDTDNPRSDLTFTVASRALAVLRLGLNELMFSSGSDYVWFKEYGSERSSNAIYAARFNLSASRFKPYIGAERVRTRARVSPEIDERARRIERMATVGSAFSLTERTALTMSAQWSNSTFDQGEQFRGTRLDTALNDTVRAYSAGARYTVTPFTTLAVTGNFVEDIFRDAPFRNSKSYSVTPVLEFAPEAALRGRVSAGYQIFAPDDAELSDSRGIVAEGALNFAISGVTTFDVIVGRNVNYSYQDTQPYYLQTGARLTVTQRLFGPLGVQGSVERQHLSYRWRRGVPPAGSLGDRVDVVDLLSGGVTLRLGRGFGILLGAEKTRRHSSEDVKQNFSRTRLLSNVTIGQ